MTPYYQDDAVTIYCGDAVEMWAWMPADVLITDPPYGFGSYVTDRSILPPLAHWAARFKTVGVFGYPELLVSWCLMEALVPKEWVTWWPTNAALRTSPSRGLTRESECIALFGEVEQLRILRERRLKKKYEGLRQRGNSHGQETTRFAGDVWTDASPGLGFQAHLRLHPNEKPLTLMSKLLSIAAAGTVLDPFMGSGTTLRAAKDLGRKAIGIEIEERYCEIAAKRCAQEVLDLAPAQSEGGGE